MTTFLKQVAVPDKVLDLIPEIVSTCRVCRQWAKPKPHAVPSLNVPDRFNQKVEADLLFMYKKIVFHMMDRCIRWEEGEEIPDKFEKTLIETVENLWVKRHGPMQELIMDGERGIAASELAGRFFARLGIKLHLKGKEQHAFYIERRGALLRDCVHRIKSQLHEEGLDDISFKTILAEAIFCCNALITIKNGDENYTPFQGLYGRTPKLLPSIDQIEAPRGSQTTEASIEHTNTLREIAIRSIVEGSARARLGRALNTRSTPAAQSLDLQVGEEIDFFRDPTSKDISGWSGPAVVIDIRNIERNVISARWQNRIIEVQVPNLRRHLHFLVYHMMNSYGAGPSNPHINAWTHLRTAIEHLTHGGLVQLGYIWKHGSGSQTTEATLTLSSNNSTHLGVFSAVKFFAENQLHLTNVVGARLAKGLRELPATRGFANSTILFWLPGQQYPDSFEHTSSSGKIALVRLHKITDQWPDLRILQILQATSETKFSEERSSGERQTPETERSDRLSTISEEGATEDESIESLAEYLAHDDKELQAILADTFLSNLPLEETTVGSQTTEDGSSRIPLSYLSLPSLNDTRCPEGLYTEESLADEVEILLTSETAGQILNLEPAVMPDEFLIYKVGGKGSVRTSVVKRDDDVLSPEEVKQHWTDVCKAMVKELQTWVKLGCISRKARSVARNVIDTRWVLKWKWDTPTVSVEGSRAEDKSLKPVRVIRARLTIRGFKD